MTFERFQRIKTSVISTGFAFALVVLIIIGVSVYLHMVRATAASHAVLRMHTVESELSKLLSLLTDAETGHRGYVITGDKAYLEPYDQALGEIEQKISVLYSLIKYPAQQQNLKEIELLLRARLDIINEGIEARSNLGFTAAQQLIQTDKGRRLMDQLRDRVTVARQFQISLLEKQLSRTDLITKRLTALFLIGGILSFTILLTAFLLLTKEIKSRRKAQEEAAQSEERFRTMANSIPQLAWMARPDGSIYWYNQRWYDYTGKTPQEMEGWGWQSVHDPEMLPKVLEKWKLSIATGQLFDMEFPLRGTDNVYRPFLTRVMPLKDEQGRVMQWFGTNTDLSKRKQAEEALAKREQQYRDLFESMDEGYCIIEMLYGQDGKPNDWRFIEVNPAFERHNGLQQAVGKTIREMAPDIELHWFDIYGKVALTGEPVRFVEFSQALNGRWFDLFAFRVGEPEQHRVAVLFTDITKRRRAEDELRMYKERLEEKNKEMESIMGIVSHDLRAPLVNIQGFSSELKMDSKEVETLLAKLPIEQKVETQLDKLLHHSIPESIQYIETSAQAMNNLVVTLVEVARAGLAPTKPEIIDMDALIYKNLESIKLKLKKSDVTYDVTTLPDCFADPTQVAQVFTNLLDNAVKYLDPSRPGQICIEGTPQADGILYWVSDNGIGIPPDQLDKIFDPYYQLKEKTSGGIGMGLATVKKLVDRNKGKIWVVSEKGKYSIFYIALPAPPLQ